MDITVHARTVHKGLPLKRPRGGSRLNRPSCPPPPNDLTGQEIAKYPMWGTAGGPRNQHHFSVEDRGLSKILLFFSFPFFFFGGGGVNAWEGEVGAPTTLEVEGQVKVKEEGEV